MQLSTEVRWFFKGGDELAAILNWFESFGQRLTPANFERADFYLLLPGINNLGLKIREPRQADGDGWSGRLEAKVLTRDLGALQLENGSVGNGNQWAKFSFQVKEGDETLNAVLNSFLLPKINSAERNHWIKMEKNRLLVFYDQQHKSFSADGVKIKEGCGIELTAIRIHEQLDYSFAFESFSSSGQQEENFFEALNVFFSEVQLPPFQGNRSFGYPSFLLEKIPPTTLNG
ncbi:MAG: hypothetical protein Q7T76_05525 [Ferruginibacter sp.]|nr:hypothetical protein [Ferruginibacter sp.]